MIIMLTKEDKKYLLDLARRSIKHYLKKGITLDIQPTEITNEKLTEYCACFVTIHINNELRGCIGSLEKCRPLVNDVVHNAIACAFEDPRFQPLSVDEFNKIKISISVLTKPEPFPVKSPEDLLKKLTPKKHGLILKQGWNRATFLPVVWEQLTDKEKFLTHLSIKAGLSPDGWRDPKTEYEVYEAIEFSE
jgi:AmmeMemoRadiSam system protein A